MITRHIGIISDVGQLSVLIRQADACFDSHFLKLIIAPRAVHSEIKKVCAGALERLDETFHILAPDAAIHANLMAYKLIIVDELYTREDLDGLVTHLSTEDYDMVHIWIRSMLGPETLNDYCASSAKAEMRIKLMEKRLANMGMVARSNPRALEEGIFRVLTMLENLKKKNLERDVLAKALSKIKELSWDSHNTKMQNLQEIATNALIEADEH